MPALRTELTEVVTGLAMLGAEHPGDLLDADSPPPELHNVDEATWQRLRAGWRDRDQEAHVLAAWNNGRAMLRAEDGLRGRVPRLVEWKGRHQSPGDEVVPADLRVDHVYLVSCKYLSRILHNASPWAVFDRRLTGGQGVRGDGDWYAEVAAPDYQELYRLVRRHHAAGLDLPERATSLGPEHRAALRERLREPWAPECAVAYEALARAVSEASAARWIAALSTPRERTALLWRLLRIGSAPYFVLGTGRGGSLRLRVGTPWDWRQGWELRSFDVVGDGRGQPRVAWEVLARCRATGEESVIHGHVEIRWSHGRFAQPPEAKVYLDTPHHRVPGYFPLR